MCFVMFRFDSDCEFVKPWTFSLSRQRDAGVALECETTMNIEWPSDKAVLNSQEQVYTSKLAS